MLAAFKKRGTGLAPAEADSGEGHEKWPSPDQRTGLIWLCRKERVLAMRWKSLNGPVRTSSGRTQLWLTATTQLPVSVAHGRQRRRLSLGSAC